MPSSKIHATYTLVWNRNGTASVIPIQLATSLRGDYGSDTLVCDNCNTKPSKRGEKIVKQQYSCSECGKVFSSIGFIKQRWNAKHDFVYNTEEKRQFLETMLDREIIVKDEMPFEFVLTNFGEILNATNPLEVFNNDTDRAKATIKQMWDFLMDTKKALLVEAKYRGDNFLAVIYPSTTGKLLMSKLKDDTLIKNPYNASLDIEATFEHSGFVSVRAEKEAEFIMAKMSGEEIVMPKQVVTEIKPMIPEGFFR